MIEAKLPEWIVCHWICSYLTWRSFIPMSLSFITRIMTCAATATGRLATNTRWRSGDLSLMWRRIVVRHATHKRPVVYPSNAASRVWSMHASAETPTVVCRAVRRWSGWCSTPKYANGRPTGSAPYASSSSRCVATMPSTARSRNAWCHSVWISNTNWNNNSCSTDCSRRSSCDGGWPPCRGWTHRLPPLVPLPYNMLHDHRNSSRSPQEYHPSNKGVWNLRTMLLGRPLPLYRQLSRYRKLRQK